MKIRYSQNICLTHSELHVYLYIFYAIKTRNLDIKILIDLTYFLWLPNSGNDTHNCYTPPHFLELECVVYRWELWYDLSKTYEGKKTRGNITEKELI